jgi:hypothetical protein
MSDEWKRKISEPSPSMWKGLLGEPIEPIVFLAVPHHSERRHRHQVMLETNRVLLDRLSLAPHKAEVSRDERALIDAVLSAVSRP